MVPLENSLEQNICLFTFVTQHLTVGETGCVQDDVRYSYTLNVRKLAFKHDVQVLSGFLKRFTVVFLLIFFISSNNA